MNVWCLGVVFVRIGSLLIN